MSNEELRDLTNAAGELIRKVGELNRQSGEQMVGLTQKTQTNRRMIVGLTVSFIVDIVLTVAITAGLISLGNTQNQVEGNTRQLQYNATVQRQKVLCPLYQVFLDSKSPEARAASRDPVKYDQAFVTIEAGYKTLKCAEFKPKG